MIREEATADPEAVDLLVGLVDGDARAALDQPRGGSGPPATPGPSPLADVEAARSARALRYEEDDHYDMISAFIKSIRGSDADAGLYWLARMLAAGEDARFIARRLVILASEDVGMADRLALVVAEAAARAVEFVGLPEAQLNLAQAVVHLGPPLNPTGWPGSGPPPRQTWPPSPLARCPPISVMATTAAAGVGHGQGYRYPHDDPRGWVEQHYRPEHLRTSLLRAIGARCGTRARLRAGSAIATGGPR